MLTCSVLLIATQAAVYIDSVVFDFNVDAVGYTCCDWHFIELLFRLLGCEHIDECAIAGVFHNTFRHSQHTVGLFENNCGVSAISGTQFRQFL